MLKKIILGILLFVLIGISFVSAYSDNLSTILDPSTITINNNFNNPIQQFYPDLETTISAPERVKIDDIFSIVCVAKNIGYKNTNGKVTMILKINNKISEKIDIGNLNQNEERKIIFTKKIPSNYNKRKVNFTCELEYVANVKGYEEINLTNNKANTETKIITNTFVDLESQINAPSNTYKNEITGVNCKVSNKGIIKTKGDLKVNLYLNNTKIRTKTLNDVSINETKNNLFFIIVPSNYNSDYINLRCEIEYNPYSIKYEDINPSNNSSSTRIKITDRTTPNTDKKVDIKATLNAPDSITLNPPQNYNLNLSCDITNIGDLKTKGEIHAFILMNDFPVHTETIDSLNANETTTINTTITISPTFSGENINTKCVVYYQPYSPKYEDINIENNTDEKIILVNNSQNEDLPDLSVNLDAPDLVNINEDISINCEISNIGTKETDGEIKVRLYIDNVQYDEKSITTNILPNDSTSINFIKTNNTETADINVMCEAEYIPTNNEENEMNLTNNTDSKIIHIIDNSETRPDLEITINAPDSVEQDSSFDVYCNVRNIGTKETNGDLNIELYVNGELKDSTPIDNLEVNEEVIKPYTIDLIGYEYNDINLKCEIKYTPISNDYAETNNENNEVEHRITINNEEEGNVDLTVQNISLNPQTPYELDTLNINCNIANIGTRSANGDVNVELYVNNSLVNTNSVNPNNLEGNEHTSISFEYNVPEVNNLNIECKINYDPESEKYADINTNNNSLSIETNVLQRPEKPDVRMRNITLSENTLNLGTNINITCQYDNLGLTNTNGTLVLALNINHVTVETTNLNNLNAREIAAHTFNYYISENYSEDTITIGCNIIYTPINDDFTEENTENNSLERTYEINSQEEGVDLAVESIEFDPENPMELKDVDIKCKFTNLGNKDPNGEIFAKLYLDDSLREVKEISENDLEAGEGETLTFNITVPATEEDINVKCKLDYDSDYDSVEDINTENNELTETLNVRQEDRPTKPDLRITDLIVDATAEAGDRINIRCKYDNYGRTETNGDLELILEVDNKEIETRDISNLDAGEDDSYTFYYTIPEDYDDKYLEVSCEINYDEDNSDYEEETTSNNKMERTIYIENANNTNSEEDIETTHTEGSDLALIAFNIASPIYKGTTSKMTCIIENIGDNTAPYFKVNIYYDGERKYTSPTITKNLASYESYVFTYNYPFTQTGKHKIKCEVSPIGSDSTLTNNSKEKEYMIIEKSQSSQAAQYNTNTNFGDIVISNIPNKKYVLKVRDITLNSYAEGKANITCNYANIGKADLDSYTIRITHNDKIMKEEIINTPLKANTNNTYTTTIDIGYDGGVIGCLITPANSSKTAANYLRVAPISKGFTTIFIIISILIIIGLIIYIIIKYK